MSPNAYPAALPCTILNTEPGRFSDHAMAAMQSLGQVTAVEADREYLLNHAGAYEILFIGLRNVIDGEIIDRASKLRCIVTPTTGTDHIDVSRLQARGIDLLSLRGESQFLERISATAELTWGLLLCLVRHIAAAHEDVMNGAWVRDRFCGSELKSRTLGIVGYGRLGRMVRQYAIAFRMNVLAFDRKPPLSDTIEMVPLEELLRRSDVVSIHLPLDRDTAGMFNHACFDAMKPGAVLINTSRGAIIDETALLAALQTGKLAGAAVDVLTEETSLEPTWLADNALVNYARGHSNLLITPHIGGMTVDSSEETNLFMIDQLATYLRARGLHKSHQ